MHDAWVCRKKKLLSLHKATNGMQTNHAKQTNKQKKTNNNFKNSFEFLVLLI